MKKQVKKEKGGEIENLKNQLARALADYDNLKKQTERQRNDLYKLASASILLKLLPILDNLRSALKHVSDSGIAIVVGELETIFKEEGLEEIKLKQGDLFDENLSEAVEVVETKDEKEDNTISEVILSGWRFNDGTVIRHSKVKVFKYGRK